MKKILLLSALVLAVSVTYAEPTGKVLKAFKESFSTAENVKWEENADYYTVYFSHSGIRTTLHYDQEGNVLGSTRYYAPANLPLNIYNRLKKEQAGKELFGVTEVTLGDDLVYFIKLQDSKYWITLKLDAAGNSQVYEKYRKG